MPTLLALPDAHACASASEQVLVTTLVLDVPPFADVVPLNVPPVEVLSTMLVAPPVGVFVVPPTPTILPPPVVELTQPAVVPPTP